MTAAVATCASNPSTKVSPFIKKFFQRYGGVISITPPKPYSGPWGCIGYRGSIMFTQLDLPPGAILASLLVSGSAPN